MIDRKCFYKCYYYYFLIKKIFKHEVKFILIWFAQNRCIALWALYKEVYKVVNLFKENICLYKVSNKRLSGTLFSSKLIIFIQNND